MVPVRREESQLSFDISFGQSEQGLRQSKVDRKVAGINVSNVFMAKGRGVFQNDPSI
jgi:hypothetical protein